MLPGHSLFFQLLNEILEFQHARAMKQNANDVVRDKKIEDARQTQRKKDDDMVNRIKNAKIW